MKLRCRYSGVQLDGDWTPVDDMVDYPECPECGSAPGDPCTAPSPDGDDFRAVEVGNYVHTEREEAPCSNASTAANSPE